MRSFFLFIIFLIPSFVYAIECPSGSTFAFQGGDNSDLAAQLTLYSTNNNIPKTRIISISNGFNGTYLKPPSYTSTPYTGYSFCVKPIAVTCSAPFSLLAGQFGANYGCKPPDCPSSHPNGVNGSNCKDSNGCTQDQHVDSSTSSCVNNKVEEILGRCYAAATGAGGNVASVNVVNGQAPVCVIGTTADYKGTAASCSSTPGGPACVVSAANGEGNGYQCGSFNGSSICVSSSETKAIGTSSSPVGSTTSIGKAVTLEDQVSTMGDPPTTTTTTKVTTPTVTTTTAFNDSSPLKEGEVIDAGGGSVAFPPITCPNGMRAANNASCDTNVVCGPDFYSLYGVCIRLPTRSTTTSKDTTVTTVTTVNNTTNATINQTSTTSSVTSSVKNPVSTSAPEVTKSGPCDPLSKNYHECVGLLSSVSDTKQQELVDSLKTQTDTALTTSTDSVNTSINGTSTGLGTNTATVKNLANSVLYTSSTCTPMSIQLGPLTSSLSCDKFIFFKSLLGWFLFAFTLFYFIHLFFKPVER